MNQLMTGPHIVGCRIQDRMITSSAEDGSVFFVQILMNRPFHELPSSVGGSHGESLLVDTNGLVLNVEEIIPQNPVDLHHVHHENCY